MSNKSSVTLEDFIEKYKKTAKPKKSYSDWISERGDTSELDYSSAIKEAQREYDRAGAGYGRQGEALSRSGLFGSGYAAYLDGNAYSEFQNAKETAARKRDLAAIKNRSGYADYLSDSETSQQKLFSDTINDIVKHKSDNLSTNYLLGIASGLSPELAELASNLGASLTKENTGTFTASGKRTLLMQMLSNNLDEKTAYSLALACGVSEEEAKTLSKVCAAFISDREAEKNKLMDLLDKSSK